MNKLINDLISRKNKDKFNTRVKIRRWYRKALEKCRNNGK